jgi:hypothetical protein
MKRLHFLKISGKHLFSSCYGLRGHHCIFGLMGQTIFRIFGKVVAA